MKKSRLINLIISVAIVSLSLAGCGSSKGSDYYAAGEAYAADDYYMEEPMMAEESAYYSDDVYEMGSEAQMKAVDNSSPATESELESASDNRKLIKDVNMTVQTKEFDALIETITNKIDALGGYAEEMNVSGFEYEASSRSTRSAYITARIPAKNLKSFVSVISENSNITSKNESTRDVTLEYSDVEARRNSLRVEQERLNELIKQAESVDVIIELENRLTDVRYELESYESRLRNIDNKVDYSTVYLDIREVKDYTPVSTPEKTFGQRIADGFVSGCSDALDTFQEFIIGFISAIPGFIVFIIILSVIVFIICLVVKLIITIIQKSRGIDIKAEKAKKAAKRAEKRAAKAAAKNGSVNNAVSDNVVLEAPSRDESTSTTEN